MLAPSVCLWTPRLSLGHPGSFKSVLDLLACVHRLDLGFTSHPKDARHSNEWHKSTPAQCPGRESNPDWRRGRRALYPLSYIPIRISLGYYFREEIKGQEALQKRNIFTIQPWCHLIKIHGNWWFKDIFFEWISIQLRKKCLCKDRIS